MEEGLGAALHEPAESGSSAGGPALPSRSDADEQTLRERLIQDIKGLSLRGANAVLKARNLPEQTGEAEAKTKLKVAVANANSAALNELDTRIHQALANP